MQKAYDKMHLLMAANAFAACPDHNKRLDVYVTPHFSSDSFLELGTHRFGFFFATCP